MKTALNNKKLVIHKKLVIKREPAEIDNRNRIVKIVPRVHVVKNMNEMYV